jgi:hypothetical protein
MHFVHNAQKSSLRRPVARTACTNSVSSHELTVVRSSGGSSVKSSASSGTVGCCWPDATLTVEWTTGTPNAFTVLSVETMFLRSKASSIERTVANCEGW